MSHPFQGKNKSETDIHLGRNVKSQLGFLPQRNECETRASPLRSHEHESMCVLCVISGSLV